MIKKKFIFHKYKIFSRELLNRSVTKKVNRNKFLNFYLITYLAHGIPLDEKASGRAAIELIAQYGTISVRAPLTIMYPMVTIAIEIIVARGILRPGSRASSPEVAIESKPTYA